MPTGLTRIALVGAVAGALMLLGTTIVVGQDASPPASPASPVPEAEPWGQVPFEAGLRDPYGASRITAVAASPRGIVAIGAGATGAAAWHSADGLTWQRATPPRSWSSARTRRAPALEDVVATADGFVVVGTERDGPKRTYGNTGSVWASEDGLTWRRTARGVGPYLNHVVEHDGRLYAISGGVAGRVTGAVWASGDATDWERVYTDPDDTGMEVIASDGETLVAGSLRGMSYSTDDGRTWSDAPVVEVDGPYAWLEDATAFDGGFLAVGARDDDGSAWHSVDGRSWEPVPETIDTGAYIAHLNAVAPLPGGGVLVSAGTDEYESYLYRSEDGQTWGEPVLHVVGEDDDSFEWPVEAVLGMEGRSLVLGHQPDGPRRFSAAVWTMPAPPVEATPGEFLTACPGRRPTIEELVVMDPAARLDCYGDRDLTFRAWLAPHEYPDLEYFGLPHWLTAGVGGLRALPVAGDPSAAMSLVLHVRPSDRERLDRTKARWAMITGHFDDPKARSCTRRWRTDCRQAFVVTAIRPARAGARATSVGGTWRKLPESPFGAALGNGVWAGDQMIVTAFDTKRIAGYDPRTKTWTRYPNAPYDLGLSPLVWTGREVVTGTTVTSYDDDRRVLLAFDPAGPSWREFPMPSDEGVTLLRAGDRLIGVTGSEVVAYEPETDSWSVLTEKPSAWLRVGGYEWTGNELLVLFRGQDTTETPGRAGFVDVAVLDLETLTWRQAAPSPVSWTQAEQGHVWTGSELVLFTDKKNNERRTFHAAYDPATDTWRTIDAACRVPARDAVWTGQLVINGTTRAYEPATGHCLRLPDRNDRTRNDQARVWTGREVIEWSGARGDDMTPIPDGIWLRPGLTQ